MGYWCSSSSEEERQDRYDNLTGETRNLGRCLETLTLEASIRTLTYFTGVRFTTRNQQTAPLAYQGASLINKSTYKNKGTKQIYQILPVLKTVLVSKG
jgi:hypothetical protein